MSSPQKGKDKKKQPLQSKKRQLLSAFHQNMQFIQMFSEEELDYLQDKINIFVFTRGQVLAKEKELIDYVGVIAEGRAVAKTKAYQIGDLIGHVQLLGYQQFHLETIVGETDGIIIAIRIMDILLLQKNTLRNKIFAQTAANYIAEISKREEISKQILQFQTVDDKKVSKYLSQEWSSFFSQINVKEKVKFTNYFPFYVVKQKQMIASCNSKPYLLYVIQGQVVVKGKQQQKVIQSGKMHNLQGFIFNQTSLQNIYCLSNEAVVLIVDKKNLQYNFKTQTFRGIMRLVMNQICNKYKKEETVIATKEEKVQEWSIFKKYPNSQILPLPKKSQNQKSIKAQNNTNNLKDSNLSLFQTLFKEQMGSNDQKQKTNASMAESGYEKLYSLKTQSHGKEIQSVLQLQKLRKQVEVLTQKLKFTEQMSKGMRLELIESKSKTNMSEVMKQIKKLYQQNQTAHSNSKQNEPQGNEYLLTFKQAFDKQTKENKIQILVAKCAFRWLYLTRKRRSLAKTSLV